VPTFELPENEILADRIRSAASRGALSHALLFTGSGDRVAAARFAAAAMECTAPGRRPCGMCEACRKVDRDIHPDVITVRDDQHQNVAVDVIRAARSDAWVRPNEGARKVYLFEDCSRLTEQDQNVLLKTVEEGPPYAAFLFCAENSAVVLPTLRSRCTELKLHPAAAVRDDETALAEALCRAVAGRKPGTVAEMLLGLEKKKPGREALRDLLEQSGALFAAALLNQYGCKEQKMPRETVEFLTKNLTKTQLMGTIELLRKYREECAYNVGVAHVLGALAVELEGIR